MNPHFDPGCDDEGDADSDALYLAGCMILISLVCIGVMLITDKLLWDY